MEYKLSTYRVFLVLALVYVSSVLSAGIELHRRTGSPTLIAFVGSEAYDGKPSVAAMIERAHAAHDLMKKMLQDTEKCPTVMTALWTPLPDDGRIYFGSSMPGGGRFPQGWIHDHVTDALDKCQHETLGPHACGRKCGEIISYWYQQHEGSEGIALPKAEKLIVAYNYNLALPPLCS